MLARLHVRRGEDDADARFAAIQPIWNIGELQRSLYIALVEAERAWPAGGTSPLLRVVHEAAFERQLRCAIEDSSLWLAMLGEKVERIDELASPYREHCSGDWRAAAAAWHARNRPYEQALALGMGDEEAQRSALAIFDELGAAPASARLRRQMRAAGVRSIPRGPIAETRANSAGLTRRQVQVLALLAQGLTNAEIAERLCISAKTAEHHVAAIMARLEASTRREAANFARKRGLLDET
jgi:DNA-binding CsgD family transcriptional regulator